MINDEAHVGVAVDQRGARVDIPPEQDVDREIVAYGRAQDLVDAGSSGSRFASSVKMMRMPTVPGVFFQSAMTSATAGSSG